jgi:hypothetical protein
LLLLTLFLGGELVEPALILDDALTVLFLGHLTIRWDGHDCWVDSSKGYNNLQIFLVGLKHSPKKKGGSLFSSCFLFFLLVKVLARYP